MSRPGEESPHGLRLQHPSGIEAQETVEEERPSETHVFAVFCLCRVGGAEGRVWVPDRAPKMAGNSI